MATWADLRTEIRYQLKDTAATPRWSDAELLTYVNYALADYSRYFPLQSSCVTGLSGDGSTTLPEDYEVFAVEYPDDTFLPEISIKPGTRVWQGMRGWYQLENKLWVLHPDSPSTVTVHFYRARDRIVNVTDVVNVPAADLELIVLYVLAKCTERVGEQSASLDRWRQQGQRDDNPLVVMVNHYYERYRQGIFERLGGRSLTLSFGRRRHGNLH